MAALLFFAACVFMVIGVFPLLRERIAAAVPSQGALTEFYSVLPFLKARQQQEAEPGSETFSEAGSGAGILPSGADSTAVEAGEALEESEIQQIQIVAAESGAQGQEKADGTLEAGDPAGVNGPAGGTKAINQAAPLVLSFAGDILFDDRYAIMASNLERNGYTPDITKSFDESLLSLMRGADLFMVNNEFPYSEGGSPQENKQYTFRAKPKYAPQLLSLGVDIVALANNHMYDYGQQALVDTLSALDALAPLQEGNLYVTQQGHSTMRTMSDGAETGISGQQQESERTPKEGAGDAGKATGTGEAESAGNAGKATGTGEAESTGNAGKITGTGGTDGLPHVGAGRNLAEACAPVYFTNGVITIGIVAATQIERYANPDTKGATETEPGVFRCLDSTLLVDKIKEMRESCDFVIAYLHWGTESTSQVDEHQKKLAEEVASAGADLIIGDHPHVLQGISLVEGVPVIYSLGNYLFNSSAQDTGLLTATLDPASAKLLSLQFMPARQENCRTTLLSGTEKARVIKAMRALSQVSIDDDGFVTLP